MGRWSVGLSLDKTGIKRLNLHLSKIHLLTVPKGARALPRFVEAGRVDEDRNGRHVGVRRAAVLVHLRGGAPRPLGVRLRALQGRCVGA